MNHTQAFRWVHHHSIPAFATKSCSTLGFIAVSTDQDQAIWNTGDGITRQWRAATRGSIPSALCAQKQRSQSHTACRAMYGLSSSLFRSTRKRNGNASTAIPTQSDDRCPPTKWIIKKRHAAAAVCCSSYTISSSSPAAFSSFFPFHWANVK